MTPYSEAIRLTEQATDMWTPSVSVAVSAQGQAAPRKQRAECSFAGCTAPWSRLWRRSNRPVFEGRWGCSKGCLRGIVEGAIRREMADAEAQIAATPHRHRVPLGLVLLAQGWITHPQLQHALAAQRAAGRGKIGHWLVEECGIEPSHVTRGLGVQWNRPVLSTNGFDANRMALVIPRELREQLGILPLRVAADRILYLGFQDQVDASVAVAVEKMAGLEVESGILSGSDFGRGEVRLRERTTIECRQESADNLETLVQRMVATLNTLQPVETRLVRIRDQYWMRMWLESAAGGAAGTLPVTTEDVVDHVFTVRDAGTRLS